PSSVYCFYLFFFNDTATSDIYSLSLHDALPILVLLLPVEKSSLPWMLISRIVLMRFLSFIEGLNTKILILFLAGSKSDMIPYLRSEEHTSELQSRENLVCRLLLEKKKEHDK